MVVFSSPRLSGPASLCPCNMRLVATMATVVVVLVSNGVQCHMSLETASAQTECASERNRRCGVVHADGHTPHLPYHGPVGDQPCCGVTPHPPAKAGSGLPEALSRTEGRSMSAVANGYLCDNKCFIDMRIPEAPRQSKHPSEMRTFRCVAFLLLVWLCGRGISTQRQTKKMLKGNVTG